MANSSDISENLLLQDYGPTVCMNLLKDHTSQKKIYWATDSYVSYGKGFGVKDPITKELITSYVSDDGTVVKKKSYDRIIAKNPEEKSRYQEIIRPRALKSKEEQTKRAKDKAEVFTPSWICNAQNNLIDEAWFGRTDHLFNEPLKDNPKKWKNNYKKIRFPNTPGKTWKDYVADIRLEITCGEAPYLANRYDTVTGEYQKSVKYRIGILDRKLRIVTENVKDPEKWIVWAKIALRSTYGFEFQGDNLLLARESLFLTFEEHFLAAFDQEKYDELEVRKKHMPLVSYIVSWNIWQMNGLTYGFPCYEEETKAYVTALEKYRKELADYEKKLKQFEEEKKGSLFESEDTKPNLDKPVPPVAQGFAGFCVIKDFFYRIPTKDDPSDRINIHAENVDALFHDGKAPRVTFESLVNKKNKL